MNTPSERGEPPAFEEDVVAIVETNVDDVTGEVIGATLERLLESGAFDATAHPFLGKKGRPGQTIRAVCRRDSAEKFARILVEETGTLGVKLFECKRLAVPREVRSVPVRIGGFEGTVSVKVSSFGRNSRIKAEVSEAKRISRKEGIPLRRVLELIEASAERKLGTFPPLDRPE